MRLLVEERRHLGRVGSSCAAEKAEAARRISFDRLSPIRPAVTVARLSGDLTQQRITALIGPRQTWASNPAEALDVPPPTVHELTDVPLRRAITRRMPALPWARRVTVASGVSRR